MVRIEDEREGGEGEGGHRVGRVLSFFQSSELELPEPWRAGECAPHPLVPGGGAHSLERGGGRVPIPTRGHTLWYSLNICPFWGGEREREAWIGADEERGERGRRRDERREGGEAEWRSERGGRVDEAGVWMRERGGWIWKGNERWSQGDGEGKMKERRED